MSTATPTLTFTQGLILGQASFIVLLLLFVRYVVFSPSEQLDGEGWKKRRAERAKKTVLSTAAVPPPIPGQILGKTGYDMATHAAESADWLNVLFAQVIQGYRNDLLSAGGEDGARQRIEQWLNPEGGRMSWLDPIEVTGLSLGSSYPLLSNARIRPADGQGRIRAEIDVDYLDSVSLSLSTSVLINFPRPRFAVLPVALGVELVSLGGTLSMQLHDPANERQHLHACLLPDFHLNLKTSSLLGSRAKLQDIPKLEQLIISRLRSIIQDRFVYPRHISLALPRLLSPSISPTPIINDIGESAVAAMGDAVKEGLSRMVTDLSAPFGGLDMASMSNPGVSTDSESGADAVIGAPASPPASPRVSDRKIPMPAGFPGGYSSTSATTQPPYNPYPARQLRPPHQPRPPQSTATTSSRMPPNSQSRQFVSVHPPTASAVPSVAGQSAAAGQQFRFRGAFLSQPGTPGVEGDRRLGALNSRAG